MRLCRPQPSGQLRPIHSLILHQLEDEGDDPDMWFWALQVLTGVNPVPEAARGNMGAMAKVWFDWASEVDAW